MFIFLFIPLVDTFMNNAPIGAIRIALKAAGQISKAF